MARGRSAAPAAVAATARRAIVVRSTRRIPTSLFVTFPTGGQTRSKCGWFLELRRQGPKILKTTRRVVSWPQKQKSPGRTGALTEFEAQSEAIIHAQAHQVRLEPVIAAVEHVGTAAQ